MPALKGRNAKVLITGANGYLALWAVQKHLEQGYSVRATVRSEAKRVALKEIFKSFQEKFEIQIIDDMAKPGAFDEAVKGIEAIQHMASPTDVQTDDPDVYIKPAVDGTLNLLKSVLAHGSSVQRVIYTSSTGAVFTPGVPAATVWTEKDWNDRVVEIVKEQGKKTETHMIYLASKVLAERAAWEFYEKHKNSIGWDFSVVCAPWLLGPGLRSVPRPQDLNASIKIFYENCVQSSLPQRTEDELAAANTWIDVRDLADSYVKALEVEEAGGERFIIAKDISSWQDWIDLMNSESFAETHPPPTLTHPLPKGHPGLKGNYRNLYDVSKATRILSPTLRSMEDTARDMLNQWATAGY